MVEPITTIASTVVALVLTEAVKKQGTALGEVVSQQVLKLIERLRELIDQRSNKSLFPNADVLQGEIIAEMSINPQFLQEVNRLLTEIRSSLQVGIRDIEAEGSVDIGNIVQKLENAHNAITQIGISNVTTTGSVEVSSITQVAQSSSSATQIGVEGIKANSIKIGDINQGA